MKDTAIETQQYVCGNCGATRQFGTGTPEDAERKVRLKCTCSARLQTFTFVGLGQGEWTDFKQGALLAA